MSHLTVLYNGNLITQDQNQPRATALAILDERIVAVGETTQVLEK